MLIGILEKGLADMSSWLFDGVYFGLIASIGIGTLNSIKTVERLTWSWQLFFKKFLMGLLIGALLGGLLSGLIYGHNHGLDGWGAIRVVYWAALRTIGWDA